MNFIRVLLILAFFSTTFPSMTLANEALAKKQFLSGLKKLKKKDYQGAVLEFEASAENYPNVNCLINLALTYIDLNRYYESYNTFTEIEKKFSSKLDAHDKKLISRKMAEAESHLSTLTIEVTPKGAVVAVDGKEIGSSPVSPIVLKPGVHQVFAEKSGYESAKIAATIKKGATQKQIIELIKSPGKSGSSNRKGLLRDRLFTYQPALLITGAVGTGVMAAVSTGLWAGAFKLRHDHENANKALAEHWSDDMEAQRNTDRQKSENLNVAAIVTTVITGVFTLLTGTELLLKKKQKHGERPLTFFPGGVEGRF